MSHSESKPTIVLVAGAFHDVSLYSPTTSLLREFGYNVLPVTLPGCGSNPPLPSCDPEIEAVRAAALSAIDQEKDVVVVMHSWAGVPGSEAMHGLSKKEREGQGLKGGVMYLVYITAAVQDVGEGRIDAAPWMMVEADSRVYPIEPENLFYNDLPASTASDLSSQLQSHSWHCFTHVSKYVPWREIPCTYVVCEKDQCLPANIQEALAGRPGALFEMVRLPAGHSPFISMPKETCEIIRRAAGEHISRETGTDQSSRE